MIETTIVDLSKRQAIEALSVIIRVRMASQFGHFGRA